MTPAFFLALAGALLYAGLAVFVFLEDRRSFVHRVFGLGMLGLVFEAVVTALSEQAFLPAEVVRWQALRLATAALVPGSWLLFSLSFARANYKSFVKRWRPIAVGVFALPSLLVVFASGSFFEQIATGDYSTWVLRLGWSGRLLHLAYLLAAVLILMNLERTLRASTGSMLWRIKFMVLGVGALFAVRIYTISQNLLFGAVDTSFQVIDSSGALVAAVLIVVSLVRNRLLTVDLYLSHSFLYSSLTVTLVGAYLLAVGLLAKAVGYFGGSQTLPLAAFLVFLALVGLAILLLSGELRQNLKRFVSRHFQRPQYDYRKEWMAFAARTTSLVDVKALCAAVTRIVSETFGVPAVTIWLLDETQAHLELAASTAFSEAEGRDLMEGGPGVFLLRFMRQQQRPLALGAPEAGPESESSALQRLRQAGTRYLVPLTSGGETIGLMTLHERLTKEPLSLEDLDLLKTIADQGAASLQNLNLSERLLRAKEMEAFQTLSAFFIHDLKNLASKLSLALQNLPAHHDDPAFQEDLLSVISRSVAKINELTSRLSPLSAGLELGREEADLNEVVRSALAGLDGSLRSALVQDLAPLPRIEIDPEQVQKVLVNLVLNARQATGDKAEIRVATRERKGWLELSVSDNGCGMSEEFMARSLFKPFHTTKREGLGIGLFHSKKIVEAHQGRIEVESVLGKGTTFRVMLPSRGSPEPGGTHAVPDVR